MSDTQKVLSLKNFVGETNFLTVGEKRPLNFSLQAGEIGVFTEGNFSPQLFVLFEE